MEFYNRIEKSKSHYEKVIPKCKSYILRNKFLKNKIQKYFSKKEFQK